MTKPHTTPQNTTPTDDDEEYLVTNNHSGRTFRFSSRRALLKALVWFGRTSDTEIADYCSGHGVIVSEHDDSTGKTHFVGLWAHIAIETYAKYGPSRCDDYAMDRLPVRKVSIFRTAHPEWGSFGVMEDCGGFYNIRGDRGDSTLSKGEALASWRPISVLPAQ